MRKMYPRMVYAILHRPTNRVYVGSSNDIQMRIITHFTELEANAHRVKNMQDDYNNYPCDYIVYVLDKIDSPEDDSKEYYYMKLFNSADVKYGYNYKDIQYKSKTKNLEFEKISDVDKVGIQMFRIANRQNVSERQRSWMPFLSMSYGCIK